MEIAKEKPQLTERQLQRPLIVRDIAWLTKTVAAGIKSYVEKETKPLRERIAALEATQLKFCGVWREGSAYGEGNAATFKGGIWIAKRATCDRPGTSDAWQLAVKRGSAG